MDPHDKLEDESPMPFGKYNQQMMQDVPADYLIWFKNNVARNYGNQNVFDYINDNLQVLEKQVNEQEDKISNN